MEDILKIAQEISPLGIIALLVIVVLQMAIDKNGRTILDKIRGTQKQDATNFPDIMKGMEELSGQNEILLENHFKHEIPELLAGQIRIENKLDSKLDKMNDTLIRIESKMKS